MVTDRASQGYKLRSSHLTLRRNYAGSLTGCDWEQRSLPGTRLLTWRVWTCSDMSTWSSMSVALRSLSQRLEFSNTNTNMMLGAENLVCKPWGFKTLRLAILMMLFLTDLQLEKEWILGQPFVKSLQVRTYIVFKYYHIISACFQECNLISLIGVVYWVAFFLFTFVLLFKVSIEAISCYLLRTLE